MTAAVALEATITIATVTTTIIFILTNILMLEKMVQYLSAQPGDDVEGKGRENKQVGLLVKTVVAVALAIYYL